MRRMIKDLIDAAAADVGNYTGHFAELFEQAINQGLSEPRISVRRFNWSSENNHIGRADGAVRLIDELTNLQLPPGQRVLLWGHSHAGNVFALMTNLLGSDHAARQEFFEAAQVYYCWPLVGCVDIPIWRRVREMLLTGDNPLRETPLDIVTFGTPIRYGWDEAGFSRLMHFINHRPAEGRPPYLAPFPPVLERVLDAVDGDYVQQFGIAGTNFMPSLFSWRSWWADRSLNRLLQPTQQTYDPRERFGTGARVPDTGETLLGRLRSSRRHARPALRRPRRLYQGRMAPLPCRGNRPPLVRLIVRSPAFRRVLPAKAGTTNFVATDATIE